MNSWEREAKRERREKRHKEHMHNTIVEVQTQGRRKGHVTIFVKSRSLHKCPRELRAESRD